MYGIVKNFFHQLFGLFLKRGYVRKFQFFSFDHFSKTASASTKIFLEQVKEVGKNVHINFSEKNAFTRFKVSSDPMEETTKSF